MSINSIHDKAMRWVSLRVAGLRVFPFRRVLYFIALQLGIIILAFIAFGVLPVSREVRNIFQALDGKKSIDSNAHSQTSIELANNLVEVLHHEAFLRSHLQLARADSIALLIDLNDSLAILTFKGVFLFTSRISSIQLNNGLERLPIAVLDSLFSGPFTVVEEISTIEKFPIVVKRAPRDTLEALAFNTAPELPKQQDVFWFFALGSNFTVEIGQQEDQLVGKQRYYRKYRWARSQWLRSRGMAAITNPQNQGYVYQLSIEIPREDARSIYRALPIKPVVVIRY